jgi:hypothetical protein
VVVPQGQGLLAECLSIVIAPFGERGEQTYVGNVKGVLGGCAERSASVQQSVFDVSVTQVAKALLEILHSDVYG